jgi:hypothetical protein
LTVGAFGAGARNLGRSRAQHHTRSGRDNWNLSLFKSFIISEDRGSRFEFRAESFDAWNHTQFFGNEQQGGCSTFGASNFGAVTSAYDPRVSQLGAKLIF